MTIRLHCVVEANSRFTVNLCFASAAENKAHEYDALYSEGPP
jgi:hypothetical protein